ncbi:Hypothetical predicted protein [Marmota monax]|uniref:Immunoglobulin domain-containing protein n=1 Tax=Marmota monax TaxID=9995 RepID=A0A5E4BJW8_MARMO|nr:Hypothetical predicted protein [Marmota monax]
MPKGRHCAPDEAPLGRTELAAASPALHRLVLGTWCRHFLWLSPERLSRQRRTVFRGRGAARALDLLPRWPLSTLSPRGVFPQPWGPRAAACCFCGFPDPRSLPLNYAAGVRIHLPWLGTGPPWEIGTAPLLRKSVPSAPDPDSRGQCAPSPRGSAQGLGGETPAPGDCPVLWVLPTGPWRLVSVDLVVLDSVQYHPQSVSLGTRLPSRNRLCLGRWVTAAQSGPLPKPSLRALPSSLVPLERSVTIWCQGPPGVDLYRLEKLGSKKYEDQNFLSISAMKTSHAGRYRCSYQNGSQWSLPSDHLELVATGNWRACVTVVCVTMVCVVTRVGSDGVFDKPSLTAHPSPVVPPGGHVTLKCQSQYGFDQFALYKEGDAGLYKRLEEWYLADFPMAPATTAHSGTYRCYSFSNISPYLWSSPSNPVVLTVTVSTGVFTARPLHTGAPQEPDSCFRLSLSETMGLGLRLRVAQGSVPSIKATVHQHRCDRDRGRPWEAEVHLTDPSGWSRRVPRGQLVQLDLRVNGRGAAGGWDPGTKCPEVAGGKGVCLPLGNPPLPTVTPTLSLSSRCGSCVPGGPEPVLLPEISKKVSDRNPGEGAEGRSQKPRREVTGTQKREQKGVHGDPEEGQRGVTGTQERGRGGSWGPRRGWKVHGAKCRSLPSAVPASPAHSHGDNEAGHCFLAAQGHGHGWSTDSSPFWFPGPSVTPSQPPTEAASSATGGSRALVPGWGVWTPSFSSGSWIWPGASSTGVRFIGAFSSACGEGGNQAPGPRPVAQGLPVPLGDGVLVLTACARRHRPLPWVWGGGQAPGATQPVERSQGRPGGQQQDQQQDQQRASCVP